MIIVIIVVVAAEPVSQKTRVTCDICKVFDRWYPTPGRAKMGLSGHKKSCRKA